MTTTEETHKHFLAELDKSQAGVWRVAQWLQSRGYTVAVNPIRRAPRHADWQEYADSGDLIVFKRVEVKHLTYNFTGRHDWPHGNQFIVCSKHSWDRAPQKPLAYVYLNPPETHAAIVMGDTRSMWTEAERRDRRRIGCTQTVYLATLDIVSFVKVA